MKPNEYREYLTRRNAVVVIGHPGNLSIEYENSSVSGMSAGCPEGDGIEATARKLGVPVCDLRPCEFGVLCKLTISGPMLATNDRDLEPNGWFPPGSMFSSIPAAQWLAAREAIGARVFWGRIERQA